MMGFDVWTEKYRPQRFSDIIGQKEVIKRVNAFVEKRSMPHLLFAGPAGVGKTTLALVVAKQLFGEGWKNNLLELNASDERGINVIRNKVKDFARTKAIGDVPFKIIYLDECDALTKEAQQALRRIMENYTQTCRFILSCNYSSKIIDPIQSRCAFFRFRPLEEEELKKIIKRIAEKENLKLEEEAKDALIMISYGDCRRLENIMQSCAVIATHLTEELVFSLASVARPKEIKEMLELLLEGKFEPAKEKLLKTMLHYGLSGEDIIKQIQHELWALEIRDELKVELIDYCGEIEFRLIEGSDETVQLEALLSKILLAGQRKIKTD